MDSERRQTDNTSGDRNGGWNLKQYVVIALVVFITFCCCILFFFMIYRYNGFADFWKKLTTILQPIIMGLVLAYLLNPVMKFLERHLMKLLEPRMKSKTKAKKMSRGVAIAGAWVFLGGIVVLLIAAIVPSIIQSIQGIATGLPSEVKNIMDWSDEFFKGDSEIVGVINDVLQKASDAVQKFLENDLLAQVQVYLTSIASGVIYTLKFLLNLVVGIIVSIYVLASQETFAGQAKKIIYAMFKPVRANVIVETVRKSNEIFGGFISGKLLDSAIIGILAYVVLTIMRMPDTILLAVIIGVTNIKGGVGKTTSSRLSEQFRHSLSLYCRIRCRECTFSFSSLFSSRSTAILSDRRSSAILLGLVPSGWYLPFWYLAGCGDSRACCSVCRSWQ